MKGRSGAWVGRKGVVLDFCEKNGMAMGCEEERMTMLGQPLAIALVLFCVPIETMFD